MKKSIQTLIGLVLVVAAGYGVFVALRASFQVLTNLSSDIAVAIIAASATAFVSVVSIVLGKIYESRIAIQKELRERRVPAYEGLLNFLFRVFMGAKIGKAPTEKELVKFLVEYNHQMMVWGSDAVLSEWSTWRKLLQESSNTEGADFVPAMYQYEKLILAVRKDLGHKNVGIEPGDILGLFVNDLDKHRKPDHS
ncbi:hypothetical protein ACKVMH_10105 [Lysobacter zhanggongensis]|uniref:DUF4760 domain-containing protein n=1 Tax=Lysobacter zhanggongensis TaxID=1774951 RepID=A0ABU7YS57_9GAMM